MFKPKIYILGIALLLLAFFPSCGKKEEGPKVIAIVGSFEITDEQVATEIAKLPGVPEDYHQAAVAALNRLIDEALLLSEAQKRNITISDAEVEKRFNALADDYPPGGLEDYLVNHNLSEKDIREQIKRSMLTAAALESLLNESSEVTDGEIKDYYDKNPAEFTKGNSVVLRRITVASTEEIELVKQKITFGDDFAAIARANSIDSEAQAGGELGEVEVDKLPESDRPIIEKLSPAAVSDPISRPNGQYVFYMLEERKPARKLTLEEAIPGIRNKLSLQKSQIAYPSIIEQLKNDYKVQVDEQNIPQNTKSNQS